MTASNVLTVKLESTEECYWEEECSGERQRINAMDFKY